MFFASLLAIWVVCAIIAISIAIHAYKENANLPKGAGFIIFLIILSTVGAPVLLGRRLHNITAK